jgi:hypothetical protein
MHKNDHRTAAAFRRPLETIGQRDWVNLTGGSHMCNDSPNWDTRVRLAIEVGHPSATAWRSLTRAPNPEFEKVVSGYPVIKELGIHPFVRF